MNRKNPAVKRIMADVRELQTHPSSRYFAQPLEDNMFEWHFTIRGPVDTPFAEGIYHGRILLPVEYPMKPPNIVFLTKNGRFEVGTKICLSISAYHEESWQPAWGIRTMLEAIISFLPSEGMGAIGALDWTAEERRKLAIESKKFCCSMCGNVADLLSDPTDDVTQPDVKPSAEGAEAKQETGVHIVSTIEDNKERETSDAVPTTVPLLSALVITDHTAMKSDHMIHTEEATLPPCTPGKSRSTAIEVENVALNHTLSGEKATFSDMTGTAEDCPVLESTGLRQRHLSHSNDYLPTSIQDGSSCHSNSSARSAQQIEDDYVPHHSQHNVTGTQDINCSAGCCLPSEHTIQQHQHPHTAAPAAMEPVSVTSHTETTQSGTTTVLPLAAVQQELRGGNYVDQAALPAVRRQPGDPGAEGDGPLEHEAGAPRDIVDEWLTVLLVAIGTSIGMMLWRIVLRYYILFFY